MCNYCAAYSALVSETPTEAALQSEAAQLLKPSLDMMLGASQSVASEPQAAQFDESALNQTL
ncbi:hypothetical protein, partial [cf. Phormidesmis sp. LEGE 11477]|uniref:hypothetical protein n=1 Tax=cf. Phormidesmis sp. LEGE 11477 TaxID=1828680 RepID=UPI0019E82E7F